MVAIGVTRSSVKCEMEITYNNYLVNTSPAVAMGCYRSLVMDTLQEALPWIHCKYKNSIKNNENFFCNVKYLIKGFYEAI